jgi:hypothetical protein
MVFVILFPADSLERAQVERDYEAEWQAAREAGFATTIFDFDGLRRGENIETVLRRVPRNEAPQTLIYRGWMLRGDEYGRLFDGLEERGWNLINDPKAYRFAHHLPENCALWRAQMPETLWLEREHFERENEIDFAPIFEVLKPFGSGAVVLKDWVKSQKHDWPGACFIPDASDETSVRRVVSRFLELTGEGLTGGLVFRRFAALRKVGNQTIEWRSFWLDEKPLSLAPHFLGAELEAPDLMPFAQQARRAPSRFFSLDFAQTEAGEWMIIEMGDGGVSGLPAGENRQDWYRALKRFCGAGTVRASL